ncbi:MAG: hypothetical protein WC934_09425 [Acidithiobacillus sp.]|jgi:hypothetical protein|uniref:hypothetical protein n=1 Tax=Acidithiobacillus TaxID=119977 RepID=UPI001C071BC3|nr:hypothetical protein [Acidithiobacillus ferrooxidans]MBU2808146.1 hypothetical protein [Acidithiobacillus ferrooxidans F221]MCR2830972.1 hypothetical protein [Acidithiobacillus ferrooxidans]
MSDQDDYTRENYVYEIFDRMKHDVKYRPVVKKWAVSGDKDCVNALHLWDEHVKNTRRQFASRR